MFGKNVLGQSQSYPRPGKVIGLNFNRGTNSYSQEVASCLDLDLTGHTEMTFEDGEVFVKSGVQNAFDRHLGNVRGHDVFMISSLFTDDVESCNDKLVKLCIGISSLKDASAHEVTAVIPYLAYARQDRKTESRSPVSIKTILKMIIASGADRLLLFDIHNKSAVDCGTTVPLDNLESKNLIAEWCAKNLPPKAKVRVLTPDKGGLERCQRFRNALVHYLSKIGQECTEDDIEIAFFDKTRKQGKVVGTRIIGDVKDALVIPYDDMISTGSTMFAACEAAERDGGKIFAICAGHGLFVGKANDYFDRLAPTAKIVTTDTVDPYRLNAANSERHVTVKTTGLMADAIRRIHSGIGSISELLN